jgi:hypothetical protein
MEKAGAGGNRPSSKDLPTRTARPDLDPQPATRAARARRVQGLLQHPPTASGHRERPTTGPATRADHRPGPARPPEHSSTRSPRRHPPRVRACRLTSPDDILRRYKIGRPIWRSSVTWGCRHAGEAVLAGAGIDRRQWRRVLVGLEDPPPEIGHKPQQALFVRPRRHNPSGFPLAAALAVASAAQRVSGEPLPPSARARRDVGLWPLPRISG